MNKYCKNHKNQALKKKLFSSKEKNKNNAALSQERNDGKKFDLKVKVNPKTVNRYNEEIFDDRSRQRSEIINFNKKKNIYN